MALQGGPHCSIIHLTLPPSFSGVSILPAPRGGPWLPRLADFLLLA